MKTWVPVVLRVSAVLALVLPLHSLAIAKTRRTASDQRLLDSISVGLPRLVTRERLVNDRLLQEEWLKKQLEASEKATFGFQGAIDYRTLLAFSAALGAQMDPLVLRQYEAESTAAFESLRRKEEIADAEHAMAIVRKQRELDALLAESGNTTSGTSSGSGQGLDGGSAPTRPDVDLPNTSDLRKRIGMEGKSDLLPAPSSIATADKIKASPIEEFRDHLAFREEIRNEILEIQLDDAHDLAGRTLYRLNFDVTVRPDSNSESRFAVVQVRVSSPTEPASLYEGWVKGLTSRLNGWVDDDLQRYRDCRVLVQRGAASEECDATIVAHHEYLMSPRFHDRLGTLLSRRATRLQRRETLKDMIEDIKRTSYELVPVDEDAGLRVQFQLRVVAENFEAFGLDRYVNYPTESIGDPRMTLVPRDDTKKEAFTERVRKVRAIAYGATPKELVQRVSEVSSRRSMAEFAATAAMLRGSASLNATLGIIRDNQRLLQGILRSPLIVGFSETGDPSKDNHAASFGWLLGPKFAIGRSTRPKFAHVAMQNSVSATLAAPGWWTSATIEVCRAWTKSGRSADGETGCSTTVLDLPGDPEAVWDLFYPRSRKPKVTVTDTVFEVVSGEPAHLLIRGSNLWRSVQVTLGGQVADRVRVLPRDGILATFDKIRERATLDEKPIPRKGVPVVVWTSEGTAEAGTATIFPVPKPALPTALKVSTRTTRLVKEGRVSLAIEQGGVPPGFFTATVGLRQRDRSTGGFGPWRTTPLSDVGKHLEADFKADQLPQIKSGEEFQVSVRIQARPTAGSGDYETIADRPIIFYASDADARISASETIEAKSPVLVLAFPPKAEIAFPGVSTATKVYVTRGKTPREELPGTWQRDSDTWRFTATVSGVQANDELHLAIEPPVEGLQFARSTVKVK